MPGARRLDAHRRRRKGQREIGALPAEHLLHAGVAVRRACLAVLFKVPVVFICENNQYAMSFAADKWTSSEKIAERGELYGMPCVATNGNDLLDVRDTVQAAVDHARAGKGPSLVVNDTYRWRGHSKSDRNRYRTQEEIDEWKEQDPILRFRDVVLKKKLLTEAEIDEIKEEGYADIEAAREFAESSPEPDVATLLEGVYAP